MAQHVVNTEQLSLFIDPVEHIANMRRSSDVRTDESMPGMWRRKESEAREPEFSGHGSGVYNWMKAGEQVRNPVQVMMGQSSRDDSQSEGHHRIAAAAAVQRESGQPYHVPVEYWEHHKNVAENVRLDMKGAAWLSPEEKEVRGAEVQAKRDKASANRMAWYAKPTAERAGLEHAINGLVDVLQPAAPPQLGTAKWTGSGTARRQNEAEAARMGNIKHADSSLERLLQQEESIERRAHGAPGTTTQRHEQVLSNLRRGVRLPNEY